MTTGTDLDVRAQEPDRSEDSATPARRRWHADMWNGWLVTAAVALVAAVLRLVHLSRPQSLMFDEVYYAKDAWSLLHHGVEVTDDGSPAFVVHPPLGKWAIALGEAVFGYTPLGWRVSAAVAGVVTVALLVRIGRRLTGSIGLGAVAGLLLAFDGLHLTMSRISMLDVFLTLWVVGAFALLLVDRDVMNARVATGGGGIRWWRLAAGLCLGLGLGTKWSAIYFMVPMIAMSLVWDMLRRRRTDSPVVTVRGAGSAAGVFFALPLTVYLTSWMGWFLADGKTAWGRDVADTGMGIYALMPQSLRALISYHQQILHFHTTLTASHPYQSSPWGWLVLRRPVAYYYESTNGCGGTCSEAVHGLGTPALWWAFLATIPLVAILGTQRRDWRALAVLAPAIAGMLPWFFTPERTMFLFYALPAIPFFVLTSVLAFAYARDRWPRPAMGAAWAYAGLVAVNLLYFWPILTAAKIPYADWFARMWLKSWI